MRRVGSDLVADCGMPLEEQVKNQIISSLYAADRGGRSAAVGAGSWRRLAGVNPKTILKTTTRPAGRGYVQMIRGRGSSSASSPARTSPSAAAGNPADLIRPALENLLARRARAVRPAAAGTPPARYPLRCVVDDAEESKCSPPSSASAGHLLHRCSSTMGEELAPGNAYPRRAVRAHHLVAHRRGAADRRAGSGCWRSRSTPASSASRGDARAKRGRGGQ